jgi:glutamyl/glutaminyl-tRNA synthetase
VDCEAEGVEKVNTRARPTPTGDLHVGHVYVFEPNWRQAKRGGDRFLLIIDDINANLQNVWRSQAYPHVMAARFMEDLAWLGLDPDEVVYSSTHAEAHAVAAEKLGFKRPGLTTADSFDLRFIRDMPSGDADQYHEWLALTRVVDDHEWGVQGFARGRDLIGERQLYDHLWRRLYPAGDPPRQQYLPVVRRAESPKKESTGAPSVRQLRAAGYTAAEIIGTLKECARLSGLAGLADVVIPAGVLEVGTHGVLEWQAPHIDAAASIKGALGTPQEQHIREQWAKHLKGGAVQ